ALNSLTRFDTRDALGSVSSWLGVVRVYKAQPCSESKVWEYQGLCFFVRHKLRRWSFFVKAKGSG
ncbi:MAG: hypothetical protein ACO3N3_16395, partial [bacterium]